jgi:hypothetical protein
MRVCQIRCVDREGSKSAFREGVTQRNHDHEEGKNETKFAECVKAGTQEPPKLSFDNAWDSSSIKKIQYSNPEYIICLSSRPIHYLPLP